MEYRELTGEQRRQLIDTQQVFEAWRNAHIEHQHRFQGSMRWAERNGTTYLLRKIKSTEKSLGPKSPETEEAYRSFIEGREGNSVRRNSLLERLKQMAPVNRAMGLGRVPRVAGKILRRCDEEGLLGEQIIVAGTNALFGYETLAGVHVSSHLLATGDIDFLFDARRKLSLAVQSETVRSEGLIGLLKRTDRSFTQAARRTYRAENNQGYMVELIRPEAKDVLRDVARSKVTDVAGDLEGAPIQGLSWLVNAPKVQTIAIDDSGLPAPLVMVDPRVFALHKHWLSQQPNRDPLKKDRDYSQAKAAALIAERYLGLSFLANDLTAVPMALRDAFGANKYDPEPSPDITDW